uniref:Uncharacterized protein n=1 Tax=Craspedostauros australis TaxID=1486917 RepID=A0A7R9WZB7_9STRA
MNFRCLPASCDPCIDTESGRIIGLFYFLPLLASCKSARRVTIKDAVAVSVLRLSNLPQRQMESMFLIRFCRMAMLYRSLRTPSGLEYRALCRSVRPRHAAAGSEACFFFFSSSLFLFAPPWSHRTRNVSHVNPGHWGSALAQTSAANAEHLCHAN